MADDKKIRDLTKGKREIPYVLVIVFLAVSFIIVFAGYTYYSSYKKTLVNNVRNELISICDLKVNQLVLWRKERLGDAKSILNNSLIEDEIRDFLNDPGHQAVKEKILSWLTRTRDSYDYKEVAVFDSNGNILLSTEKDIHQDQTHIILAKNSLEKKEVTIADLHKEQSTGEIDLGLFIPFFISRGKEIHASGGIMLLVDPEKFLFPLIQSWPVPSETAETLLVKQDGNDVLYLNELRHKKNTALSFRMPITNESLPAAMAVRGKEGVVEGNDYRNISVMAALQKVPDTGWFFIAKIDTKEAYLPAQRIVPVIYAFVLVGIFAAGLGIGLFWRNKKAIFYRRLYEAEEALRESEARFTSLIKLAPIPLCYVNREGGLIYINDRFIQLFGYTLADVPTFKAWWQLACPEESYRRLVVETWEKAVAGAAREEMDIEPLEFKVTCKNGTVRVMEISGITIKDNFLASFIDLTERKKAEEAIKLNEDRLEALLKLTMMKVSSEKEITDFALEEAVRLTRSKGGYLHFFNEDEQTIQLYSWSKDVLNTCKAEKGEHYPLDKAGVWADSVRFRRPVIHNDYQNLTEKKGYPEGHFELLRHLGVPIFEKDRIVGVMGVGNKAELYNQTDVRQLTLLMDSMWGILKQKHMDIEREKLIKQLQESLANIKTLSGMLPICASCKKIRDDKGYWKQVESYVSEHTEAVFSHGICPDCAKKAYEELEKFKKDRNL